MQAENHAAPFENLHLGLVILGLVFWFGLVLLQFFVFTVVGESWWYKSLGIILKSGALNIVPPLLSWRFNSRMSGSADSAVIISFNSLIHDIPCNDTVYSFLIKGF